MTFEDFILNTMHALLAFHKDWTDAHFNDPQLHPMELDSEQEWLEMFISWKEAQDNAA